MNQVQWISIISLVAWLVLAVTAYRSHRLGAKKTVVLALAWLAIFFLVAAVFTAIGH
jgi:predicted exporter